MAAVRWAFLLFLTSVTLAACRRASPQRGAPAPGSPSASGVENSPGAPKAAGGWWDARDAAPARAITHRWTFALRDVSLTIEDVGMSRDLGGVLARTAAELVVNAGFFDERGQPIGLALSGGKTLSPPSRSLSGGVLTIADDVGVQTASESFTLPEPAPAFGIQCRPRLVVAGKRNIRKDDGKRAERTALCLRDEGRTLDVILARTEDGKPLPTLYELADELVASGCEEALNLDGGPSTGAAHRADAGAPPEILPPRGPVRHAVVVRRRPPSP